MPTKNEPATAPATLQLNTPSKRLFFVIGASGPVLFVLGIILVLLCRGGHSDFHEIVCGLGKWCLLTGPLCVVTGLFGSFFYDYTIRPVRDAVTRLGNWIAAG